MTKKDYIKLANIIKENTSNLCDVWQGGDDINRFYIERDNFLTDLCDILKSDNPNFDRQKFINAACDWK